MYSLNSPKKNICTCVYAGLNEMQMHDEKALRFHCAIINKVTSNVSKSAKGRQVALVARGVRDHNSSRSLACLVNAQFSGSRPFRPTATLIWQDPRTIGSMCKSHCTSCKKVETHSSLNFVFMLPSTIFMSRGQNDCYDSSVTTNCMATHGSCFEVYPVVLHGDFPAKRQLLLHPFKWFQEEQQRAQLDKSFSRVLGMTL